VLKKQNELSTIGDSERQTFFNNLSLIESSSASYVIVRKYKRVVYTVKNRTKVIFKSIISYGKP